MASTSRRAAIWLLACLLLLGGCGGTPTPSPTPSGGKAGGTGTPINGGTMNIAMALNPESFSPLEVSSREMVDVFGLTHDALVRFDDQMRATPALAERWTLGPDGKTWTITLRQNATFHNGQGLSAQDVVYTLDQLKAIYTSTTRTSLYSGAMALIDGYAVVDDHTLTITAKDSSIRLWHWLNFPIVQKNSLVGTLTSPPVGTGAYRVQSYEQGKQMTLTANDQWWRRRPYLQTIVAKAMPDPETALTSMGVRLLDVVHTTSLTAHSYKQQGVVSVSDLMTQELECIVPNMQRAPFGDVRMRKAIISALDRKTIITEVYLNHAVSIDVPLPPDTYLYDASITPNTYSPANAKEQLAAMGYADSNGDGFVERDGVKLNMEIIVNESTLSSARVAAANMAKKQLAAVGIDCKVTTVTFAQLQQKLKDGTFDLAFTAFSVPYDGDLRFLIASNGTRNYGKYHSTAMDALLESYARAESESAQVTAAAAVQQRFAQELPLLPLYFRTNSLATAASVLGVTSSRDMDVYKAVEKWYMFQEGDEQKVTLP